MENEKNINIDKENKKEEVFGRDFNVIENEK